uniref:Uncharacterized protein n=1 Tax=viral metagenome TaxID=1070528 RepID=A0A6C0BY36_9ZZZZ
MYIVHNINNIDNNSFFFGKKINNTVISNGRFIRLLYSTPMYTLNSILLNINLNEIKMEKSYIKYKCRFNPELNNDIIDKIKCIEENILKKADIDKKRITNIAEQLRTGLIKIFIDNTTRVLKDIILKISGIWETEKEYGVTYKFMFLTNTPLTVSGEIL